MREALAAAREKMLRLVFNTAALHQIGPLPTVRPKEGSALSLEQSAIRSGPRNSPCETHGEANEPGKLARRIPAQCQGCGMISIPLISGFSMFGVKVIWTLPSVTLIGTLSM